MKLRSTTPAITSAHVARYVAIVAAILFLVTMPIQVFMSLTRPAAAVDYDAEISAMQRKIDGYESEASALRDKANTLQNTLNKLAAEKAKIQAEVDKNQLQYNKLAKEIKDTEARIEENAEIMGALIKIEEKNGNVSTLVMFASNPNVADFIEDQANLESTRDNINGLIDEDERLQKDLEKKKNDVQVVLEDQKANRAILANKEAEQQRILNETRGNEAQYKKLISDGKEAVRQLEAEAAAVRAALAAAAAGGNGVSGGSAANQSGYPFYNQGDCSNTNDGYGYFKCQCVSYVAYRLASDPSNRGFSGLGNADNWWNYGKTVSPGDVRRGDVVVWITGPYGHVMYVEGVSNGVISYTDFNGVGGDRSPGAGTVPVSTATSYPMKVIRFN